MAWYLSGGDVVGGVYWHVHAMWSVVDAVGYAGLYRASWGAGCVSLVSVMYGCKCVRGARNGM